MFKYKKTAAFIMSLLICTAVPSMTLASYAENDTAYEDVEGNLITEDDNSDDDETIVSGDYEYSLTIDGKARITAYSGSDEKIVVPDKLDGITVSEIGASAFLHASMSSIEIPASIEYIAGENPFMDCKNLTEFIVAGDNSEYCAKDGILYSKDMSKLLCYPISKKGSSFTIPDTVSALGIAAFCDTQLEEIIFPSSLSELDRHAVSYNLMLTKADLSGTQLDAVSVMCFAGCTLLSDVKLPDSLLMVNEAAFAGCANLAEITLPESLTYVGQNAFAGTALESIRIPASVSDIGYCAFGYDSNLNPIDGFIIIGEANSAASAYATDSDTDYEYKNDFKFYTPEYAEQAEEFAKLDVKTSDDYAYAEIDGGIAIISCSSAESVVDVPAEFDGIAVTRIYDGAFSGISAAEINLPDTVETIGDMAFRYCQSLKSIVIPDSVHSIGDKAFSECSALESVVIPGSCETIGEEPFFYCTSLKEISMSSAEGGNFSSENGILYNKDKTLLVMYPTGNTNKKFTAPSTVKEIAVSAFCDCGSIEELDLSDVEIINNYAFENCTSLKKVKLSKNLKTIGNNAFYDCTSLKSVRLYNNVETIGDYALGFTYADETDEAVEDNEDVEVDENAEESEDGEEITDKVIKGFKIYADKDSLAFKYCDYNGIECVTDSVELFGKNFDKTFLYAMAAILGATVLALIGIFTGKAVKKKKSAKQKESKND